MNDDGCINCNYTGTINTFRWVTDDSYPLPREVATVKLCNCYYERQFRNYDPSESFSEKELRFTFKNAVTDEHNRAQFAAAVEFVRDIKSHMENGTWIYIFGDQKRADEAQRGADYEISAYGTGKTYMMQCIANALSRRRIPGLFVKEERLFGDIKSTYNRNSDETEDEVLERYYRVPILMIDDIFTAGYKDWAEGKLFSILDERDRNNKVTIMTSNYAPGRIRHRLPEQGGKIASRINGRSQMIELLGPDRRPE